MEKKEKKSEHTRKDEFIQVPRECLEEECENYREQLFNIRNEMAEREKDFEEFKQAFKVIIKNL
jgi:hypothetical protein